MMPFLGHPVDVACVWWVCECTAHKKCAVYWTRSALLKNSHSLDHCLSHPTRSVNGKVLRARRLIILHTSV